ncbi:MAG: hypothetical protein WC455_17295 [Dehalococcoidia bacterium]
MKKQIKRFVTFWTPGIIVAESTVKEVGSLDPNLVKWPENAYAFQFSEREDVVDGEKKYRGTEKDVGPLYYHPDSRVETLAQVKKNPRATATLISNMECNGYKKIIWSRWGNWPQPFDDKKTMVLTT